MINVYFNAFAGVETVEFIISQNGEVELIKHTVLETLYSSCTLLFSHIDSLLSFGLVNN